MNLAEAELVMARARAAQTTWARVNIAQRCTLLGRLRREIAANCEMIADTIAQDAQKTPLDALSGDVMVTLEMLRYCEAHSPEILRFTRARKPAFFFRGASFEVHYEPHGVALIFSPSNYPFQLSMVPMVTALAAGNAVVLKCSERLQSTAALIDRLVASVGFPKGLVQVLQCNPQDAEALIDARPDIIFFTGSTKNGRIVAEKGARHLIPTMLELGGSDAALIFADCNLDRAVKGIVYGAFSNTGRTCVAVKRAYAEAAIYDEFLSRVKQATAALRVCTAQDADLYPLAANQMQMSRSRVQEAVSAGAVLHWPNNPRECGTTPTILSDVPWGSELLAQECFGPVLCVAPFSNESEAITFANASSFALSSSIWTGDHVRARRVAAQLNAGSCAVNDVIRVIANPHVPFGGNRMSGFGRYHGVEGLRAFSRTKTVMFCSDRRDREKQWFPAAVTTRVRLAQLLRLRHGRLGTSRLWSRLFSSLALGAIFTLALFAQSPPASHLTINVLLTPNAHGELAYLIFNSASGFPGDRDKAVHHGFLAITPGAQQAKIEVDLAPGTYAVTVYEDLNGNRKLDHNFLGIPREPAGASGTPVARMGPPRFSDCAFHLGTIAQAITIKMEQGL